MSSVGDVIAEQLAAYDTEHFFLLTGADNEFFISLCDRGIRPVLARSERAAAYMADAYARLTRRASFVYGQFGPGAAVALSGLVDAKFAHSPVVALTSDIATTHRYLGAYQELDQVALFRSFVKWAGRLERADRAAEMVRHAVREAITGCPGPAYLGVPRDVMVQTGVSIDDVRVVEATSLTIPPYRPRPDSLSIEAAARVLESANRPVILAGTGTIISGAWTSLGHLAEAHDLPVVTSVGGKGSMAESHSLCHGVVGRYSRRSANVLLQEADVVLAVGTRLGDMTTDRGRLLTSNTRVVQLDIDPSSVGLNLQVEVGLIGDARQGLIDLETALSSSFRNSEWAAQALSAKDRWLNQRRAFENELPNSPVSPVSVMAAMRNELSEHDLVVTDTGYMTAWTSALYDARTPGNTHLHAAGSLGWAVPASLGAQLAAPGKRVVAVTGDGGIGYHLADLETAARLGLPVVFIVLNNGTLAFEYQVQSRLIGRVEPLLNDFRDTNYAEVARALGVGALRVSDSADLAPSLRRALDAGGPMLLDVLTDRDASAPVTNYEHLEERKL